MMATSPDDLEATDDVRPEYDFRSLRGVVRGKYAARHQERLGKRKRDRSAIGNMG
jgi:hypothetical protein